MVRLPEHTETVRSRLPRSAHRLLCTHARIAGIGLVPDQQNSGWPMHLALTAGVPAEQAAGALSDTTTGGTQGMAAPGGVAAQMRDVACPPIADIDLPPGGLLAPISGVPPSHTIIPQAPARRPPNMLALVRGMLTHQMIVPDGMWLSPADMLFMASELTEAGARVLLGVTMRAPPPCTGTAVGDTAAALTMAATAKQQLLTSRALLAEAHRAPVVTLM